MRIMCWVAALAVSISIVTATAAAADKLVIYNWTEYIPDGMVERFSQESGIEVEYATFDSNETMYAKVKLLNGAGYDLIVPSSYYISKMAREGLLQPIDKRQLTELKNLDPALLDKPYDPGNRYSIPYLWGSTGIGVDSSRVDPATVTRWADLWKPEFKGQVLLTDDVREVFQVALSTQGYSANTTDPDEIKAAYELLQQLMPSVRLFNSDAPRIPYLAGDVSVGMLWNGEAWMAREESETLKYIYPKEGAIFWVDSFAIPVNAANPTAAHRFIDYILRPENAKEVIEYTGFAAPNLPAMRLLDSAVLASPTIFPDTATIAKGEFQKDIGDETLQLYNRYWQKLKSH
ncbi:extracellular solute-binding protein [Ectothiorhodospiraceae bacterium BW-2]|nr:extracellular solute-binding protein [Ectothiorhodospiraceae bacterium BW-2]